MDYLCIISFLRHLGEKVFRILTLENLFWWKNLVNFLYRQILESA